MPTAADLRSTTPVALPMALHGIHAELPVDAEVAVRLPARISPWSVADLVEGAGFHLVSSPPPPGRGGTVTLRRGFRLADTVGPDMALLVCGVNASLHAAEAGVGYVGPGNRFWPAMVAAGAVSPGALRHPRAWLVQDGVGMTDLVKRPTPRAADVGLDEQRAGRARVERLCATLAPRAVLIAGLSGWRAAVDRRARPGWQPVRLGPSPVYLMPSTSGLNAATPMAALVDHVRAALEGAPPP